MDRPQADGAEIVDRRTEADRVHVRARSGLEFPRELVPLGLRDRDPADHVAAVEERPHPLEQRLAAPDGPRARRREHLVPREHEEVGTEVLDVDGRVRDGLRGVHEHRRAGGVRLGRDLAHRIDGAEAIGGLRDRQELRALAELGRKLVAAEPAIVVHVDHDELGADVLRELLPGHEIRVVLEDRRDDPIAPSDVVAPPRVGHEVDALGRVADEDDLALARGVDEARHLRARFLERGRRPLAELVDATVDVRVVLLEHALHRLEHLTGLLARRCVVEIDDALAVHPLLEDREVRADACHVERRRRADGDGHQARPA